VAHPFVALKPQFRIASRLNKNLELQLSLILAATRWAFSRRLAVPGAWTQQDLAA
jgi:hypothetical protein